MNQPFDTYINLLLRGNFNVEELDYRCGSCSALVVLMKMKQVMKMVTMKVMEMEMFKLMNMIRLS